MRTPRFGGPLDILAAEDRDAFRSHRPTGTTVPVASGGRNGRVTSALLAELRDDLLVHETPSFAKGIDGPKPALPFSQELPMAKLLARSLLLDGDGDDDGDATFVTRAPYVSRSYHVPIDESAGGSYLAPSRPAAEPSTAHKDRWLAATRGSHRTRRVKPDRLYREARRHVRHLVKQNRRLASANGV